MEIAIDTGNKQVKTDHSISISGVVPQNTIPATARPEDYIRYRGRYYTLTNKRQEYLRDGTLLRFGDDGDRKRAGL